MATRFVRVWRQAFADGSTTVDYQATTYRPAAGPGTTGLFQVDGVRSKDEAVGCVLEYAAGRRGGLCVRVLYPEPGEMS